jgi:hypothetical protein
MGRMKDEIIGAASEERLRNLGQNKRAQGNEEDKKSQTKGSKDTGTAYTIFDKYLLTTAESQADDGWWLRYNRR